MSKKECKNCTYGSMSMIFRGYWCRRVFGKFTRVSLKDSSNGCKDWRSKYFRMKEKQ